ncbi:hypothetical protein [Austwickia chelonae]|uniref:hypothetical protein n=1 Tax=Austwickia chelonae TaxID=100225 RepID=UPI000E2548EE|nr:hypothetical protein [Austwickia chelonae]
MNVKTSRFLPGRLGLLGKVLAVTTCAALAAAGCGSAPVSTSASAKTPAAAASSSAAEPQGEATTDTAAGVMSVQNLAAPAGRLLDGLECRAKVASTVRQTLYAHELNGSIARMVERQGQFSFQPVLLARGGGMGDVGSGMETFVATDPQGRLHYIEVSMTRDDAGKVASSMLTTDVVLGEGYDKAKALGASVAFHINGDPEIFVVDAKGQLLRYEMSAAARQIKLSEPKVIATGLRNVTSMSVESFDLDGNLAVDEQAATRVLIVDGDTVKQTIVMRDGTHDGMTPVLGPHQEIRDATAITRMWCAQPDGPMTDQGGLVFFWNTGGGVIFTGNYTPAVKKPNLTYSTRIDPAVTGLLAG